MDAIAKSVRASGANILRGGAFKPRTSPYSFQGMGRECLPWVFELAGKYGIGIISLGSMSEQGLLSLPTQWGFAEEAAKKAGTYRES